MKTIWLLDCGPVFRFLSTSQVSRTLSCGDYHLLQEEEEMFRKLYMDLVQLLYHKRILSNKLDLLGRIKLSTNEHGSLLRINNSILAHKSQLWDINEDIRIRFQIISPEARKHLTSIYKSLALAHTHPKMKVFLNKSSRFHK